MCNVHLTRKVSVTQKFSLGYSICDPEGVRNGKNRRGPPAYVYFFLHHRLHFFLRTPYIFFFFLFHSASLRISNRVVLTIRHILWQQRAIMLFNGNLPTHCQETSLRAFISWIAGITDMEDAVCIFNRGSNRGWEDIQGEPLTLVL